MRALALLVFTAIAFALAGCGGDGKSEAEKEREAEAKSGRGTVTCSGTAMTGETGLPADFPTIDGVVFASGGQKLDVAVSVTPVG